MNAKTNLGRGLSALLGDEISIINDSANLKDDANRGYRKLPIAVLIANSHQPRSHFNEESLQELATSLKVSGMLQPILVRPAKNNENYEIIAGERRWRAAQKAGLHEVPVIIREINDQEVSEIALIENMQREDLNPVEEAIGLTNLQEKYNYTQEMLSERIGKSRSAIANSLRLLNLPNPVLNLVKNSQLTASHVRPLIGLEEDVVVDIANQIIAKKLSVRVVEGLVTKLKKPEKTYMAQEKNPNILSQEKAILDGLGIKAEILQKNNDAGKIILHFSDKAQYKQIIEKLTG